MERRAPHVLPLAAVILIGLALRLGTWGSVFTDRAVLLDGTDGYYHLRRALAAAESWPRVPATDCLMSVPDCALVQWPPLFDLLVGTVALPFAHDRAAALETAGALLPPLLGLAELLLLALLVARLWGARAALAAAAVAAVLPGAVRYTLLGAFDHDPFVELGNLLALAGIAGLVAQEAATRRREVRLAAEIALGLVMIVLSWPGAPLYVGLLGCATLAAGFAREPGVRASLGNGLCGAALVAAAAAFPFVVASPWTAALGASFAGLSWLQLASLLALGLLGSAVAWSGGERNRAHIWAGAATLVALLALAPVVIGGLLEGLRFLGREHRFPRMIAESRPLLSLFGGTTLAPLLVRLSVVAALLPAALAWLLRRRGRTAPALLLAAWSLAALGLALLQSRYTHTAAFAVAAVAGVLFAELSASPRPLVRRSALPALALCLAPVIAAYVALPGLGGHRLYGRLPAVVETGMDEIGPVLRAAGPPSPAWGDPHAPAPDSVLAPWDLGHFIEWLGHRATVANPFGPMGQTGFEDGLHFYETSDPAEAIAILERRRVAFVVVTPDRPRDPTSGRAPGLDPASPVWRRPDHPFWSTTGARLAFLGPGPLTVGDRALPALPLREVFRTRAHVPTPLGPQPVARLYQVLSDP